MTFPAATDAQLQTYLGRIDFASGLRTELATLNALHLAHATHIPFENIDVLLRRPIRLDLDSLHAKLVSDRRGGYCFEHNLLFAAVLEKIGFVVTRLAARVRYGSTAPRPRTHMLLMVDLEGARWLVDVGFGAEGLLLPVPLGAQRCSQFAWTYRVVEQQGTLMLQSLRAAGWTDLYTFTLEPQLLPDYAMANHFVSTHPDSPFVRMLTAQLPTPAVRYILRGRELIEDRGAEVVTSTIAGEADLRAILADRFGLNLPSDWTVPLS